jgi:hypothetical protein
VEAAEVLKRGQKVLEEQGEAVKDREPAIPRHPQEQ